MSRLTLTLFGAPCLVRDGVALRLRSRKCLALLAYLAVTETSHRRERLAALLWPESDAPRAANSLRYTLSLLRRALDGAWLAVDREMIALDGSERRAVDVVRFRALVAECRTHGHAAGETCPHCLPLLSEAVELYQGDFLAGFTLRDSPEFDEWQAAEGGALRREVAGALERLAEGYAAHGEVDRGVSYAQRWVALDGLQEAAHRCLMRLYAGSGRRSEALLQYEACAQVLQEELGVGPAVETAALYEAIMAGAELEAAPSVVLEVAAAPHNNLPVQPTPFVGRKLLLEQMADLLGDPGCRLLTVVGPGGMGKTRLAIKCAEEHLDEFADGVCLVALASVESAEFVASAVLDSLGLPRQGTVHPRDQLLRAVRVKELLLILDNFEHLMESVGLVTEMVAGAPGVKVVVTSRERLNVRGEWLLPVEGMAYPGGEGGEAGEEEYSAVELFVQCARRVQPGFTLAQAGPRAVGRICRLVEGMPLAIEMAASWAEVMGCRDIAREIEGGVGFLATTLRDVPPRHRSMRAAFDSSWRLLKVEEKRVLGRLAVFRGGFRREAAEAVAGASLGMLSRLVHRSWLRPSGTGRFEMHELVRQYAGDSLGSDKLETDPSEQGQTSSDHARDLHSRYYAAFVQRRQPDLFARRQREAFEEILEEMDNVWAAWNWAVARADAVAIGQCVRSLGEMAELRGWRHEMDRAFEEAAAMLRAKLSGRSGHQDPGLGETGLVLAELLPCQALKCVTMGLPDRARALCEEALSLLGGVRQGPRQKAAAARAMEILARATRSRAHPSMGDQITRRALSLYQEVNDPRGRAGALLILASTPHHLGRYDDAERLLRTATAIAEEVGDLRYMALCLGNLGEVLRDRGDYGAAKRAAEEALQIRQSLGDRVGVAHSHFTLGYIATALGHYEGARQHHREGLALGEEIGSQETRAVSLCGLGIVALAVGQHAEAKQFFRDSLADCPKASGIEIHDLVGLGHAARLDGDVEGSRRCFCRALAVAMSASRLLEAQEALVGLAYLLAEQSELEQAAELLGLVLCHPATRHATRAEAQGFLSKLAGQLPSAVLEAARVRGEAREMEDVVAGLLGECVDATNGD
jgi:DNA-binding SARP family transcriptional activator/tetratricopeptide (TPR) repeat protein